MIQLEGARIERSHQKGGLPWTYFSPNGQLWLPGMGEGISIAIQIIQGLGQEAVILSGRAPSIGLKSRPFFWAGRLPDGSDLLIHKTSLREYFGRTGVPIVGSERETLIAWQDPMHRVQREVVRRGVSLSTEQRQEVVRIQQRHGGELEDVVARYLLVVDGLNRTPGEGPAQGHYREILHLVDLWSRLFEDVVGGYFECLAQVKDQRLLQEYWRDIETFLSYHPALPCERAVQYFFLFDRFSLKNAVPLTFCISNSPAFMSIAQDFRISVFSVSVLDKK